MRSLLDVRLGVLEPQIVHLPPDVHSLAAAEEAIELADRYGLADGHPLDESQRFTLRAGLGEREDGSWAASTVADFEPRQNGKNDTCAARELAGLILFKERLIIHTAHEFPTANESFLRLVAVFENWDDLRRKVARIRYANGEQGIELLSGQRLKYRARTGGSGRGFAKADLVVYDEAQHLQAEHVAASGPARLANPNNQSWYMGSGGLATSANAWRMRRRALAGDAGRFAYIEHTAEDVSLVDGRVVSVHPDVTDRDAWAKANPAYGRRITDESFTSLLEELGPELFARECLCLWDAEPSMVDSVVPADLWRMRLGSDPAGDRVAYGLDASPDLKSAAIGMSDGRTVLVAEHHPGSVWLPPLLKQLLAEKPGDVWLDPKGPVGALLVDLTELGIGWREITPQQHAQACGGFLAAVSEGDSLRHRGQPALDAAVAGATRRPYGDAWAWNRRTATADICPLVAVTLARWGALSMAPAYSGPLVAFR